MHVRHVGAELAQRAVHVARGGERPQRAERHAQRRAAVEVAVVALQTPHHAAARLQQARLGVHHLLLAAALAVGVVDDQDAHVRRHSSTPAAKRRTISSIE